MPEVPLTRVTPLSGVGNATSELLRAKLVALVGPTIPLTSNKSISLKIMSIAAPFMIATTAIVSIAYAA